MKIDFEIDTSQVKPFLKRHAKLFSFAGTAAVAAHFWASSSYTMAVFFTALSLGTVVIAIDDSINGI